jgi:hypothetical protein
MAQQFTGRVTIETTLTVMSDGVFLRHLAVWIVTARTGHLSLTQLKALGVFHEVRMLNHLKSLAVSPSKGELHRIIGERLPWAVGKDFPIRFENAYPKAVHADFHVTLVTDRALGLFRIAARIVDRLPQGFLRRSL